MELVIGLLCIPVGLAIFAIARGFLVPLTQRIPTSRKYWPGVLHSPRQGG